MPQPEHCGAPMTLWEIPAYYDGALFYLCEACGRWQHRFPPGHEFRRRAERAIADGQVDAQQEVP